MIAGETRDEACGPIAALIALWGIRGLLPVGGAPLGRAVEIALPLGVLALVLSSMRRSGTGWAGCALLADLAFMAASLPNVALPALTSILVAGAYWNVIEVEDRRLSSTGRHHPAFVALPLIQIAWALTGGASIAGAVIVLAYAMDVLAGALFGGRHLFAGGGRAGKLGIAIVVGVAGGVCAATLAGPSGLGVAREPPGLAALACTYPAWIAAAAILVVSAIHGSPMRAWRALASVLFIAIGTIDVHFLPCFALAGPLTVASCWRWRAGPEGRPASPAILAPWPAAAITVAIAICVLGAGMRSGGWR